MYVVDADNAVCRSVAAVLICRGGRACRRPAMPLTHEEHRGLWRERALLGRPAPTLARVESVGDLVTAGQVPDLLFEACPWLSETWDEVADENVDTDSPGGRLGYLDAAWVVGQLADRLVAGDTSG